MKRRSTVPELKAFGWITIVVGALATSACVVPQSVALRNVATAKISPEERSEVWGRALREFQARGILVAVSDRAGGVLASQGQPSTIRCGQRLACESVSLVQFLIGEDGEASLRINRTVRGETLGFFDLLEPGERAELEREPDELLAVILGRPTQKPQATSPPPRRSASGALCDSDAECPKGYTCSLSACRR
jgi:hypothetical protein